MTVAQSSKKPRIATMLEPSIADQQTAVITAVHQARELLTASFREIEKRVPSGVHPFLDGDFAACRDTAAAVKLLDGVQVLLGAIRVGRKSCDLVERAVHAGRAAVEHGAVYKNYADCQHSEWDQRYVQRARQIWARSTEAASQETHRALAELAELLPHGYETEGEET